MAKNKKEIDSLFRGYKPENVKSVSNLQFEDLPLDQIDYNPKNTSIFNMDEIESLSKRIEEEGYNDPILVFEKEDGRYEILSGHRRFEAMKLLGKTSIPGNVFKSKLSDTQKDLILLSSNIATRKLAPLDMARAIDFYKSIIRNNPDFKGNKRQAIAAYFGITESNVHRYEVILKLIPELQEYCKKPNFPYSSLSKAATLSTSEQKELLNKLIRLEADKKKISEEEVDKDEILFSRTRVELIINNMLKTKEKSNKQDKTAYRSPLYDNVNANKENLLNYAGLDQCVAILESYKNSVLTEDDKIRLKEKLHVIKETIKDLESSF